MKTVALDCIESGIAAASPERAVGEHLQLETDDTDRLLISSKDESIDLSRFDEVVVAGGGKASVAVARGLETLLGDRIDDGVIVSDTHSDTLAHIDVAVGDHPVPSERGIDGTDRVRELLESATERTLVLAPITGGGSALLVGPVDGVSLDDLRTTTTMLLESGASIDEINAVRTRLSAVKGGGLAQLAAPATVCALLVSDVVGDDPATIASGPFTPQTTNANTNARSVLDRYDIDAPVSVQTQRDGETIQDDAFSHVQTTLLVSNRTAIDAAAETAREHGYRPLVLSTSMRGEAREIALSHVSCVEESRSNGDPIEPPAVLLSGGEATVTVTGDGRGGPNIEFALAAAIDLPDGVTLASVDTDGRDGSTDAAGAVVDSETVDDQALAREALADNDAYPYLAARDALVSLDSTTNVNDLRVFVIDT